jgi:uncharacterized paraquat-inducible protein A
MPEHYTKNTVSATIWCKVCGTFTPHRLDQGRQGPCLRCMDQLQQKQKKRGVSAEQGHLFSK